MHYVQASMFVLFARLACDQLFCLIGKSFEARAVSRTTLERLASDLFVVLTGLLPLTLTRNVGICSSTCDSDQSRLEIYGSPGK